MSLAEVRSPVAVELRADGLTVFEYMPETATDEFVIVVPGDPYVQPPTNDVPFRNAEVRLMVLACVERGDNESIDDRLDVLIEKCLAAINRTVFDMVSVHGGQAIDFGGTVAVGSVIEILTNAMLGEP